MALNSFSEIPFSSAMEYSLSILKTYTMAIYTASSTRPTLLVIIHQCQYSFCYLDSKKFPQMAPKRLPTGSLTFSARNPACSGVPPLTPHPDQGRPCRARGGSRL